jgi:peptidoglycan hydrolase-like protein with peptidoglycan-binding domain
MSLRYTPVSTKQQERNMPRRDEVFDDFDGHSGFMDGMIGNVGETLRERPGTFAAMVTFVALFGFVASNALWHQPNSHESAFYSTRDNMAAPAAQQDEAPVRQVRKTNPMPLPENDAAAAIADPTVMGVQATLRDLRLYEGEVDGVMGSRTRQAIAAYQGILRMPQTGEVSEQLLANLRAVPARRVNDAEVASNSDAQTGRIEAGDGDIVASIRPSPRPKTGNIAAQPEVGGDVLAENGDPMVMQIQAGLRQYLNIELVADGQMGSKTRKAIEDFQNIVRLPVTGKVTDDVLDRMRNEGLIN